MLVSVDTYRRLTGDSTTANDDVEAALIDAQQMVEEYIRRPLESGEVTETLIVVGNKVYPSVTPVTDAGELTIEGLALTGFEYDDAYVWSSTGRATVTYTGGYTDETVPYTIKEAICNTAHRIVRPQSGSSDIPYGAQSVRLGDMSVTYSGAGAGVLVGGLTATVANGLKRYVRTDP